MDFIEIYFFIDTYFPPRNRQICSVAPKEDALIPWPWVFCFYHPTILNKKKNSNFALKMAQLLVL